MYNIVRKIMHQSKTIKGKHIVVHELNPFFRQITQMMLEHFDIEKFQDTLFVLGGYILNDVKWYKEKFPGMKIIAYQLEQMMGTGNWNDLDKTLDNLSRYDEVWDYDEMNVEFLKNHGISVSRTVPMLYTSSLDEKLSTPTEPDIDVLFYGYVNERRWRVFEFLQRKLYGKLRVAWVFGEPDIKKFMSNSKTILNIHAFEPWNRQEQPRIFYPVINSKTVISEKSQANRMENMVIEADINHLVDLMIDVCKTEKWIEFGINAKRQFKIRTDSLLQKGLLISN